MKSIAKILADGEWLILLLIIPAVLFFGWYGIFLLSIPILFVLIRKIGYGYFIPPTPYNLAILILFLQLCLSLFVVFDPSVSIPKVANLLMGIILFFAGIHLSRSKRRGLWFILAVTLLTGVGMAVVGLLGSVWEPPFDYLNLIKTGIPVQIIVIPGTVGGIVNANELAGTLCWIAPLMIALLIGTGKRLWNRSKPLLFFLVFGASLTSFVLLATLSRGGILAYIIGLSVIIGIFVQPRWRLVLAVGLLVAGFALFFKYQNPQQAGESSADPIGLLSRLEIWNRALLAISDFPLTGVSVNGFRVVVDSLYPLFQTPIGIDIAHSHNHFLQVALDLGIFGLVSYVALWLISGTLLCQSWKFMTKMAQIHHPYYALIVGLLGSLVAGFVFGVFDAVSLGSRPSFIWWMLLSLTGATHYAVQFSDQRLRRSRRRHSESSSVLDAKEGTQPEALTTENAPPLKPHSGRNRRRATLPNEASLSKKV
jgi:O-antigen ligase